MTDNQTRSPQDDAAVQLSSLIKRLQELKGPDRELDAAIAVVVDPTLEVLHGVLISSTLPGKSGARGAPDYTGSIDAKLPGEDDFYIAVEGPRAVDNRPWYVQLFVDDGATLIATACGNTEPLARRAAALKAREALR